MYNTVTDETQGASDGMCGGRAVACGVQGMVDNVSNFRGMKLERATYVVCDQCQAMFKAGTFKDGSTPTACPTCRVGVDPKGQSVTIDTESRF
jgi:hypothetical protein